MKITAGILFLLAPVLASAQGYPGMSEADMQNMMKKMQEMQSCMQGIDQSRMQAFEQQASSVQSGIKSLCSSGNRDGAQKKAMAFAQQVSGDPDIVKMRECSAKMKDMMPALPYLDQAGRSGAAGGHVCDQ